MANPSAPHHVRRQFCVSLLACLCAGQGAAWAQDGGAVIAQVQSLDRYQAEQERLRRLMEASRGYEDKVMDSSSLPAAGADTPDHSLEGPLRSFFVESRATQSRLDDGLQLRAATELGQRVGWRQQTINHGEFVLEADVRRSSGTPGLSFGAPGLPGGNSGERITVRNLAFPVTPTLFADTALGDISTEVTEALGRTYRISLGSTPVRGASARLFDNDTDLRVGTGARGLLGGGPVPGFLATQGQLTWAGLSRRFGDQSVAGVQVNHGTDLPAFGFGLGTAGQPGLQVTSVASSVGTTWTLDSGSRVRGRVIGLQSRTTGAGSDATASGVFVEGAIARPQQRHDIGVFTAQPGLRFGDTLVTFANRGAYWRMDQASARLSWGAGIDADEQDPGQTLAGTRRLGVNGNLTWRVGRDTNIGGSLGATHSRFTAPDSGAATTSVRSRSMGVNAFVQTRLARNWGRTTLRLLMRSNETLAINARPATGEELLWEQEWLAGNFESLQPQLSTSLGIARDRSATVETTSPTAGVQFRLWPDPDWSISGTLRYTARDGNLSTSRGLAGTADTELQLQGGWRVGASLSLNQAVLSLQGAGLLPPQVVRTDARFASVYLRWDETRGSRQGGIGASGGGAGAGAVEGVVFFDADRDGERRISEAGVADVEVVLDGRYRTRTDRDGRFAFPLVTTGRHRLTVTPETVPLPWGAPSEEGVVTEVPLRGTASVRLPVVRVAE